MFGLDDQIASLGDGSVFVKLPALDQANPTGVALVWPSACTRQYSFWPAG